MSSNFINTRGHCKSLLDRCIVHFAAIGIRYPDSPSNISETTISPHQANTIIVKEKEAHTPAKQNHKLIREKSPSSFPNNRNRQRKHLLFPLRFLHKPKL